MSMLDQLGAQIDERTGATTGVTYEIASVRSDEGWHVDVAATVPDGPMAGRYVGKGRGNTHTHALTAALLNVLGALRVRRA